MIRSGVAPELGAAGILRALETAIGRLDARYDLKSAGIGFGGPVDSTSGRTRLSHQIEGWEDFAIGDWFRARWPMPVALANDCDAAALAEARWGAGRGRHTVFFVTVGTGVGGGLVIDRTLHGRCRAAVAEIGHLRPGLQAERAEQTVESLASGWGIAAEAAARARGDWTRPLQGLAREAAPGVAPRQRVACSVEVTREHASDLRARCDGDWDRLTARHVAAAAAEGNLLAQDALDSALQTLGWAIAQAVTLTAADIVVVGGGVSLLGESQFFAPLRRAAETYVFPPLRNTYEIVPAALGEEVVLHGAIALAPEPESSSDRP